MTYCSGGNNRQIHRWTKQGYLCYVFCNVFVRSEVRNGSQNEIIFQIVWDRKYFSDSCFLGHRSSLASLKPTYAPEGAQIVAIRLSGPTPLQCGRATTPEVLSRNHSWLSVATATVVTLCLHRRP